MTGWTTTVHNKAFSALTTTATVLVTLSLCGCSLTSKKPEVTAAPQPRPTSAAQAMQQAVAAKQVPAKGPNAGTSTAFVDPMVSARPNKDGSQTAAVSDFRSSGRSAEAMINAQSAKRAARPQVADSVALAPSGVPAQPGDPAALAGVVTQPTGIQAGRNSIFSAAAPIASEPEALAPSAMTQAGPQVSSAPASLSTDAVAYAPVRRINAAAGSVFAGGQQVASADGSAAQAPAAAAHAPPGFSNRPSAMPSAEPLQQGLW